MVQQPATSLSRDTIHPDSQKVTSDHDGPFTFLFSVLALHWVHSHMNHSLDCLTAVPQQRLKENEVSDITER